MKKLLIALFWFISNVSAQADIKISIGATEFTSGANAFDYGDILVDSSFTNYFMIENIGEADLTMNVTNAVSISGTNASHFTMVADSPSYAISIVEKIEFDLIFDPTTTINGMSTSFKIDDLELSSIEISQSCIPAQLVINEVTANISGGCDMVELRVVQPGTMNGIALMERTAEVVEFTSFDVELDELIIIHFNGTSPTCNPISSSNETLSVDENPEITVSTNFDTAFDWYIDDSGITNSTNVLTLLDASDEIMDVILAANNTATTAASAAETAAFNAANAGEWEMVGGGVPPGGFIDADFIAHAVIGLKDVSNSIQRLSNSDTNIKTDWVLEGATFGSLNSGQSAFPADNTDPIVLVTSAEPNPTTNSVIKVTLSFDEEVCGFAQEDISIGNGSITEYVDNLDNSFDIEITVLPGTVTVDIDANVAVDAAGNGNQQADQFSIDVTNTQSDIIVFTLAEQTGTAVIDDVNHTVAIEVDFGTDVTTLVSTFTLSSGASAEVSAATQTSTITSNDFTSPVTYTITAEDGVTTQDWVVTVKEALNTETDITAFSLAEQTVAAIIDAGNHTVAIEVDFGTDLTRLVSTFTLSSGANAEVTAIAQISATTANDFTSPVTYTITAEDGVTTQDALCA